MKKLILFTTLVLFLFVSSCGKKQGCTDETAINYDADAEKDDKSCEYYSDSDSSYSDLIIGSWKGKTMEITQELSDEMINGIIEIVKRMDSEDFKFKFVKDKKPGGL